MKLVMQGIAIAQEKKEEIKRQNSDYAGKKRISRNKNTCRLGF